MTMTYVYNLSSEYLDQEYSFSPEVSPEWAVCYAYASENNLLSLLFNTRGKGTDLDEVFPLVFGKYSVCCGDYVTPRQR